MYRPWIPIVALALANLYVSTSAASATDAGSAGSARTEDVPAYLSDRGSGVPLSMFGSYIERGELFVYPFFEYYRDDDLEYQADDYGFPNSDELRGRYRAREYLIFVGYGLTDHLAVEFEAAYLDAELFKSADDMSGLPDRLAESGLGDVEAQLRWRWSRETESRPEWFSYFETVFPTGDEDSLIGTSDWELKLGLGLIKGLSWGTVTVRGAVEYSKAETKFEAGEYAVEYLKRLSPAWRLFLALEGSQDELTLITEMQWHLSERAYIKLNNGFGLTSKAGDWTPEIGIVFRF